MVDIKEYWSIQKYIGEFHLYTMGVNSIITCLYLLLYPKVYFNINSPKNDSSWVLTLGFFTMPLYYLIESYTTLHFCQAFIIYTCKYIIHHLLTISLMLTVFQHSFFNFFTLISPTVHGFMNLGYYYSKSCEYIFCRWYAASTIFGLIYFFWVSFKFPKFRLGALQVVLIGVFLGINNFNTPELVEMCKINENVYLLAPEWTIHLFGILIFSWILFKCSRIQVIKISV
jgi:hypothetical protein